MKIKRNTLIYIAVAAIFCFTLFLFTKKTGSVYIKDSNGNVISDKPVCAIEHIDAKQPNIDSKINPEYIVMYSNSNRWPTWTPFYKKYYGFANLKNGFISDDIYVDKIAYGSDGLAWDYKGHFIDENGDIAITVADSMGNYSYSDNPRKFFLNLFYETDFHISRAINDRQSLRDFSSIYSVEYDVVKLGDFDDFGYLVFPFKEGYAYIDKNGTNVFGTFYKGDKPTSFYPSGFAVVDITASDYDKSGLAVINTKGEYVIAPSHDYVKFEFDKAAETIIAYTDTYYGAYHEYDFEGNRLENQR